MYIAIIKYSNKEHTKVYTSTLKYYDLNFAKSETLKLKDTIVSSEHVIITMRIYEAKEVAFVDRI